MAVLAVSCEQDVVHDSGRVLADASADAGGFADAVGESDGAGLADAGGGLPDVGAEDVGAEDVGPADASSPVEPLPVLTPCPEGWEERSDADGLAYCEPWPGSSPVKMTPCPDGWREVTEDEVTFCDPYPAGGPLDCAADEAHFPGRPGCEKVGTACPAGDFPEGLPDGVPIVYVLQGAEPGGDGSFEAPYRAIGEVQLDGLDAGTIVAVGEGEYVGEIVVPAGLTLWGKCPGATVLTSTVPAGETAAVVSADGSNVVVKNLSIRSAPRVGLVVERSTTVTGVVVDGVQDHGVLVEKGGTLTASRLVVRETLGTEGGNGAGLSVRDGTATVTQAVFHRNQIIGVYVSGASGRLNAYDVAISDSQPDERSGYGGLGLEVWPGSAVEGSRWWLRGNRMVSLSLSTVTANLDDVVVLETHPSDADGQFGFGAEIIGASSVVLRRAHFQDHRGAIKVWDESTLTLEDGFVRDSFAENARGIRGGGYGILVNAGAAATLRRSHFVRNMTAAVGANGEKAELKVYDTIVRDSQPQDSNFLEATGTFGEGIALTSGATGDLRRCFIDTAHTTGVAFASDTRGTMDQVVIRGIKSQLSDGAGGIGLLVVNGSTVTVSRVQVHDTQAVGVVVAELSRLFVNDFLIDRIRSASCTFFEEPCSPLTAAVAAEGVSTLELQRGVLSNSVDYGLWVGDDADASLHDATIRRSAVGVSYDVGFPSARVRGDTVVFESTDADFEVRGTGGGGVVCPLVCYPEVDRCNCSKRGW